jgi:TonB family protein
MLLPPKLAKCASFLILSCSLLSAGDVERKVVLRVEPEYPEIARKMQIRGIVKLKLWIRGDGTVIRVEYIGGHPLLAESAVSAVRKWKFESRPSDTTLQVGLKFSPE